MDLFITLNTKCLVTEISVFLSFHLQEHKGLVVHILVSLSFYTPWSSISQYRFLMLMGFRRDEKSFHSYKHSETIPRKCKQFNILCHFKSWRFWREPQMYLIAYYFAIVVVNTDHFLHPTKTLCVLTYHSPPLSQTQVIDALLAVSTKMVLLVLGSYTNEIITYPLVCLPSLTKVFLIYM